MSHETIADLNRQQQQQLRRLERLRDKLNQYCEDLNLNHLITHQQSKSVQQEQKQVERIQLPLNVKRVTVKINVS